MRLRDAFRLSPFARLALVGAGGKTSALFQLGGEFAQPISVEGGGISRPTVLLTATAHLGVEQALLADRHFVAQSPQDIATMADPLLSGVLLVTAAAGADNRLGGVSPEVLAGLRRLADERSLPLLIEADGSRTLPLKAPAAHEPPIPPFVDTVVVAAGLSALGKPLDAAWVHRPEIFSRLSGLPLGEALNPQALVSVLTHPEGGLKNIPSRARRIALLNQADAPELQAAAAAMAGELLTAFHAVVIAALQPAPGRVFAAHERIAGVILAAGEARRFGQPKQLLLWKGEPFVRHVARAAVDGGLSPVVVVAGEITEQISAACAGLDVQIVHNPDWAQGQSASIRFGLQALPPQVGGAVFLLADQPLTPAALIRLLVESHAAALQPILAPLVDGKRANPVLFDRVTFDALMALQGDVGGRAIFARFPVDWLPWHDASILLDVDTPQDYQRLLERGDEA